MLTIYGKSSRYCDGISRRSFIKIGALGIGAGALTLADLNRLEAAAGSVQRQKAVINIFLGGGPPSLGSVVAKLKGPVEPSVPPFVGLAEPTKEIRWSDAGKPGFLGPAYAAFKPDGEGRQNMVLKGLSLEQLQDRRRLLSGID